MVALVALVDLLVQLLRKPFNYLIRAIGKFVKFSRRETTNVNIRLTASLLG